MRLLTLFLTACLFAFSANAQTISGTNFPVTYTTGTLVDMTTATQRVGPGVNDSATGLIPIGFTFGFMGRNYDSVSISTNGFMRLGSQATAEPANTGPTGANLPRIAPYWDNLSTGATGGSIKTLTAGVAPNRTFTVQWLLDVSATTNVPIQATLYESNGRIQFDYGLVPANGAFYNIIVAGNLTPTVFQTVQVERTSSTLFTTFYNSGSSKSSTSLIQAGSRVIFQPDSTKPVAPAQLQVTPYTTCADITFVDSCADELYFELYRSTNGVNYTLLKNYTPVSVAGKGTTFGYHDTALVYNTTYYYKVTSHNVRGSAASVVSKVTLSPHLSGVRNIPADYPTINAALDDIYCRVLNGNLILELDSSYHFVGEVFPLKFLPKNKLSGSTYGITLRPAPNVVDTVIFPNTNNNHLLLEGCSYVTIDGRPGGVGNKALLKFASTSYNAGSIGLTKGASHNTITYCNISQLSAQSSGIYLQALATDSAGCNSNTIAYNNIIGKERALRSVAAAPHFNLYDTIVGNNFYNYESYGIQMAEGNQGWLIKGNSFYQTAIVPTNATYGIRDIEIIDPRGGNHYIVNNFFGGNQPGAVGLRSVQGTNYKQFSCLYSDIAKRLNFEGNIVKSIYTGLGGILSTETSYLLRLNGGEYSIGTLQGNMFGDTTVSNNLTGPSTGIIGIGSYYGRVAISNNVFAGINMGGGLRGLAIIDAGGQGRSEIRITNNRFGKEGVLNSITSGTAALYGLGLGALTGNVYVMDNTFANFYGTGGSSLTFGVMAKAEGTSRFYIINNRFSNFYSPSTYNQANTSQIVPLGAINIYTTNSYNVVSGNVVTNFVETATVTNVVIHGIHCDFYEPGEHIVEKNHVSNIRNYSNVTNYGDGCVGIWVRTYGKIYNNVVSVGVDSAGAMTMNTMPHMGIYAGTGAQLYNNSIYVGINQLTAQTYGINGGSFIRNNIIVNDRDTTKSIFGSAALANNVYKYNAPVADAGAIKYTNPLYINPVATAGNTDLRVPANSPVGGAVPAINSVFDDLEGNLRPQGMVSAGAYELNPANVVDTTAPFIYYTPYPDTFALTHAFLHADIADSTGVALYGAYVPRLYFKRNSSQVNYASSEGDFISGDFKTAHWLFEFDTAKTGPWVSGDTIYYFVAAQDISTNHNLGSGAPGFTGTNVISPTAYPAQPNFFVLRSYVDTVAPVIEYNPMADTTAFNTRKMQARIYDITGLAGSGSNDKGLYMKKNYNGTVVQQATATLITGDAKDGIWESQFMGLLLGSAIVPGDTIYYMWWARDVNGRLGSNPPGVTQQGSNIVPATLNYFVIRPADTVKPVITYPLLPNCAPSVVQQLTANITDNQGIINNTYIPPKVYYKARYNGGWKKGTGNLASGTTTNGNWNFSLNNNILNNLQHGDTVYYFVVASDAKHNTASNPAGISAYSPDSITVFPPVFNYYLIDSPTTQLPADMVITNTVLPDTLAELQYAVNAKVWSVYGLNTTTYAPRIYYKKSNQSTYQTATGTYSGTVADTTYWGFTIDSIALGSLNNLDTIQYFVAAQDTTGYFETNPAGGTGANIQSLTAPATLFSFVVHAYPVPPVPADMVITNTVLPDTLVELQYAVNAKVWSVYELNTTTYAPRIYYKKSTQSTYQIATGTYSGTVADTTYWGFTIDSIALGSLNDLDTIQYFVAAQDTTGYFETNPAGGTGANIQSLTAPAGLFAFVVHAYPVTPVPADMVITNTVLPDTLVELQYAVNAKVWSVYGLNTTTYAPRIYYKKSTQSTYQIATGTYSGTVADTTYWGFTIDSIALGSLNDLDTIQYFLAAQDTTGYFETNPAGGTGANIQSLTAPLTLFSFVVHLTDTTGPTFVVIPIVFKRSVDATVQADVYDVSGTYATGTEPRIYFKKHYNGTYASQPMVFQGGSVQASNWELTLNPALNGNWQNGDTVYYYLIAQDNAWPVNNVSSSPAGVIATSVTQVSQAPDSLYYFVYNDGDTTVGVTTPNAGAFSAYYNAQTQMLVFTNGGNSVFNGTVDVYNYAGALFTTQQVTIAQQQTFNLSVQALQSGIVLVVIRNKHTPIKVLKVVK